VVRHQDRERSRPVRRIARLTVLSYGEKATVCPVVTSGLGAILHGNGAVRCSADSRHADHFTRIVMGYAKSSRHAPVLDEGEGESSLTDTADLALTALRVPAVVMRFPECQEVDDLPLLADGGAVARSSATAIAVQDGPNLAPRQAGSPSCGARRVSCGTRRGGTALVAATSPWRVPRPVAWRVPRPVAWRVPRPVAWRMPRRRRSARGNPEGYARTRHGGRE
jgi:hypothetical protein